MEKFARWCKLKRGNADGTIQVAKTHITQFLQWLQKLDISLDDIDQETMDDYLMYCNSKYAKNTMVPVTVTLRKFCQFLGEDIEVKVVQVKASNRDKTSLTKEQVEAMFKASKGDALEHAVLKTLYYTGMRQKELRNLDIEDVDFDRLRITIKHGKGDRSRTVNITQDCAAALNRWLMVRPKPKEGHEQALFLSCYHTRISSNLVWSIVKRNAAAAGIEKNVYPHKFRITNITRMAEAGLSPREIQAQSGHKDLETLIGYIQHSPERIRESYDRAFGHQPQHPTPEPRTDGAPEITAETQRKTAIQKYLDGEIDRELLNTVLSTIEHRSSDKGHQHQIDPSYQ